MMLLVVAACLAAVTFSWASGSPPNSRPEEKTQSSHQTTNKSALAQTATYKLLAWSELGMHCIDGKDYSIFSVLPPYNVVHAQLIKMG